MVDYTFEGEVNALSEKQQEFVKNVLEELGVKKGKVVIEAVGKPGDNYVANVKKLVVEKDGKIFKIIAKIAPTQEIPRQTMNTAICFSNENMMYSEVLPKFTQLEKDANIAVEERLKYAKLYGSYLEAPHEIILLEDLTLSDFVMLDRLTSLKDDSIKLVLKNFAKLHASSYALKNLEPETFEIFAKKLINIWELMGNVPEMDKFMKGFSTDIINAVDDEKYIDIIDQVMSDLMKEVSALSKIDKGKSYSVIQQGDPWTNNILFKLEGDKSIDCCLIDYQISKESSPVADLTYMIFNCTDFDTRSKHFHDWINYYHSELERYLNYYGLKTESTYPRNQLDEDFKRYSKFSLGQSIMMASMLIRESKDAGKFKEAMDDNKPMEEIMESTKMTLLDEATLKRFSNRVIGLIDTFFKLGYLKE
ncbi:uncharacterized protein LOC113237925 [Hyposmocoma kahamanoa]|uniref:uncharacterized protein LOC113237925 n=1 Tax=Hyposmocoma kahamanoa TaxID=1477025 RepID=UPI000E6D7020|nr:uncharacterized protein LOC113237925 [Hyposmocoma kahamanoa]